MKSFIIDYISDLVAKRQIHYKVAANMLKDIKKAEQQDNLLSMQLNNHIQDRDIAIIGMAGRFPYADNTDEFWEVLKCGASCIEEIPESRWSLKNFYDPMKQKADTSYSKWGAFIKDIDKFDADFFNISEEEATSLDPQQRIFLEIAYEAFEMAGYPKKKLWGSNTGVFVGNRAGVYKGSAQKSNRYNVISNMANFIPARVSDFFSLKGPSINVDTACSSSLVCVHMACQSLLMGECDMAIAGGIDFKITPQPYISLSSAGALSPDGKSYVFDKKANGFVPGEGGGAVILKTLKQAINDGDTILAVIKGSAANNDGHTMGITSPNLEGQKDVLKKAYEVAGISPADISYVETHGTGTTIGDPIEIKALSQTFSNFTDKKAFCALGSVKTNIGHLDTAAGVASLIKVILALLNKKIPATLNCDEPNPRFNLIDSPFYVSSKLMDWKPQGEIRATAISSFGFGGTNCHVVLTEAPEIKNNTITKEAENSLFVLSAKSETSLNKMIDDYIDFLGKTEEKDIEAICNSAYLDRDFFNYRIAVITSSVEDLKNKLMSITYDDKQTSMILKGHMERKFAKQPVFLFTGQGAIYPGAGKALMEKSSQFRDAFLECEKILKPYMDKTLTEYLYSDSSNINELQQTEVMQPVTFALGYSLSRMWQAMGLTPAVLIGHSVGEYIAACIGGIVSLEDGLKLIAYRGKLMQKLDNTGAMVAVFAGGEDIKPVLDELPASERRFISIAAFNSSKNTVLSGRKDILEKVINKFKSIEIRSQYLRVSHAFHSKLMEPMLKEFAKVLDEITFRRAEIPLMSNLSGELTYEIDKDYLLKHIVEPVYFYSSIEKLNKMGHKNYLEIGPNATLANLVKSILEEEVSAIPSLLKGTDDVESILKARAALYCEGYNIPQYSLNDDNQKIKKVLVPGYKFDRKSFWVKQYNDTEEIEAENPLIFDSERKTEKKAVYYKNFNYDDVFFKDHIVLNKPLVAGMVWVEAARRAAEDFLSSPISRIKELSFLKPLEVKEGEVKQVEIVIEEKSINEVEFLVQSRQANSVSEEWTMHAQGIITGRTEKLLATESKIDINEMIKSFEEVIDKKDLYNAFADEIGIMHGPYFRGVKKVYFNRHSNVILTELSLDELSEENKVGYFLHPGLLDSSLQGMLVSVMDIHGRVINDATFIPFYLKNIEIYSSVQGRCFAISKIKKNNNELVYFDITIVNQEGEVLIKILDSYAKRIPNKSIKVKAEASIDKNNCDVQPETASDMIFKRPVLAKLPALNSDLPSKNGAFLVFTTEAELSQQIISQLKVKAKKIIKVGMGFRYHRHDKDTFVINPLLEEDYLKVFNAVLNEGVELDGIIHLWSLGSTKMEIFNDYEDKQVSGTHSLFFIAKTFTKVRFTNKKNLWILTKPIFPALVDQQYVDINNSSILGLAKTISYEIPLLDCHVIENDLYNAEQNSFLYVKEILKGTTGKHILLRKGERYEIRYSEVEKLENNNLSQRIKTGGVYVVLGGLGGIAIEIASFLAENQSDISLVLISKNGVPAEAQWDSYIADTKNNDNKRKALSALKNIKKKIRHLQIVKADVTDINEMTGIVNEIRLKHGRINGVIHAAGLISDSFIVNKDIDTFTRVIDTKAKGAVIIDELTAKDDLDFFIMFSSIASIDGNIGQADYAAANSFLDSFSYLRSMKRKGKTLAINWGLWAKVGMGNNPVTIQNAINAKVRFIEPNEGVKAFFDAFSLENGQVIIYKGQSPERETQEEIIERSYMDTKKAGIEIKNLLKKMIQDAVQNGDITEAQWEENTFLEMGMDSSSLVKMIGGLEKKLELKLYPTIFFEYQTVDELAQYLSSECSRNSAAMDLILEGEQQENAEAEVISEAIPIIPEEEYIENTIEIVNETEKTEEKVSEESSDEHKKLSIDMAIVGYALRLPGAKNEEEFWHNLKNGVDSVTEVPNTRWDIDKIYSSDPQAYGKTYCRYGGFVEDIDKFDPLFFNISPREANVLDTKQRLMLEVAWEAIEQAGYCSNGLPRKTGVFIGTSYNNYYSNIPNSDNETPFASLGNGNPLLANRLSNLLNLNGPSMIVDTYCSSSLVAVHLACQSIMTGECEMALVGGAHTLSPNHYSIMSGVQALSYSGKCKSFDDSADGYVPGEGATAILIKPLSKALEDGDYIHSVIKATAVNHCGHSNNMTSPNASSQEEVVRDTYVKANINPETISYIEAHGTGTSLGDPIEIKGISNGFRKFTQKKNFCAIGSVKTNIGHLEPASGLAGLVKVILALKHKVIPPTLNFNKANKFIDFNETPFYINDKPSKWTMVHNTRRAGISAFGLTGTNAHVILEEAPKLNSDTKENKPCYILGVSAKNKDSLKELISGYVDFLKKEKNVSIEQLTYTALLGRLHFPNRIAIVATSKESITDKINLLKIVQDKQIDNMEIPGIYVQKENKTDNLIFVFGGDSDRKVDLSELMDINSFRTSFEWIDSKIKDKNDLLKDFAVQYAMASMLISIGVNPKLLMGYGYGKFLAAAFSGLLSIEDAIRLTVLINEYSTEKYGYGKLKETIESITINNADIPIVSEFDGSILNGGKPSLDFWIGGNSVDSAKKAIDKIYPDGSSFMLYLSDYVSDEYVENEARCIAPGESLLAVLYKVIAKMYVNGINIKWQELLGGRHIQKTPLPTYPFNRSTYWLQNYSYEAEQPIVEKPSAIKPANDMAGKVVLTEKTWVPKELTTTQTIANDGVWVIFEDEYCISKQLIKKLGTTKRNLVLINQGDFYVKKDSNNYEVNIFKEEDFAQLFKEIVNDFGKISCVLNLLSCYHPKECTVDSKILEKSFYRGSHSMFFIAKALSGINGKYPQIIAVSTDAVSSTREDYIALEKSTLPALLKVIKSEFACNCRLLDFSWEKLEAINVSDLIIKELQSNEDASIIMYRNGIRYVEQLAAKDISSTFKGTPVIKNNGVYVVVGGGTGIGLLTSKFLAGNAKAKLIIIGRTELPSKDSWNRWILQHKEEDTTSQRIKALLDIEREGGTVEYYSADVADFTRMTEVIQDGKRKFGTINGVIHSGGIKEDKLIRNKTFESYLKVFKCKTIGTYVLDMVTIGENLDFFIMYSSLSALAGNAGQSDYAAANSFMDYYALKMRGRNGRRYLSINWPYWQDGSMAMPDIDLKNMIAKGILPLQTDEAFSALQLFLYQIEAISNIGVIKQAVVNESASENRPIHTQSKAPITKKSSKSAEKVINKMLIDVLFMREEQLSPEVRFDECGLDSLMLQKCIQYLEKEFSCSIEPGIFFEYPTIKALAEHLFELLPIEKSEEALSGRFYETTKVITLSDSILEINEAIETNVTEEEYKGKTEIDYNSNDIAIIGLACRFPGADSIDEFWDNLSMGISSINPGLNNRWNKEDICSQYGIDSENLNKVYTPVGGYIEGIDKFDAEFFGIPEGEAPFIDPQHRILLETVWRALENSGYSNGQLSGSNTGVFVGARGCMYKTDMNTNNSDLVRASLTGKLGNFNSARISDFLNLKGPSIVIDTACSSSLVSTHYACKSILNGECDVAISCGVEIKSTAENVLGLCSSKAISFEGKSYVFDQRANGFVAGEGAGAIILKSLKKAIQDGDTVYAVIKGSAVNNDGHTMGITTPDMEGQEAVIDAALRNAKVDAATVSYIEAHGTGTMLGDPIEVKALTRVFEKHTKNKGYCGIGSVKTNIGHLDTAAGIASIIKVVLSLYNKRIPPTLNIEIPNKRFKFIESPFYPAAYLADWKPVGGVRRAGISSFGFGGTNCHMILEEAPAEVKSTEEYEDRREQMFLLSAKSQEALKKLAANYSVYLSKNTQLNLGDICFTAGTSRSSFKNRLAVLCSSTAELSQKLGSTEVLAGDGLATSQRTAFMFTGQGAQYPKMAMELYENQPIFRAELKKCDEILSNYIGKSLIEMIYQSNGEEMKETSVTQPITFAINYALAKMWMACGVKPAVVMGHSVGEYVAACIAGIFTLEDGLKLIAWRGRLMQEKCRRGAMAALMCNREKAENLINSLNIEQKKLVSIGAHNGYLNTVISGDKDIVKELMKKAESENIRSTELSVSHGFHSPMMEPMLRDYERILDEVAFHESNITIISGVTGQKVEEGILGKEYWLRHVMEPVDFYSSVKSCEESNIGVMLEIGATNTLCNMAKKIVTREDLLILSTLKRGSSDWRSFQEAMSQLYLKGININYRAYDEGYTRKRIALPLYPFNGKKYWAVSKVNTGVPETEKIKNTVPYTSDLPRCFKACELFSMEKAIFTFELEKSDTILKDHVIAGYPTLVGVSYWDLVLQAAIYAIGTQNISLREIVQKSEIKLDKRTTLKGRVQLNRQENGYSFSVESIDEAGDLIENCVGKLQTDVSVSTDSKNIGLLKNKMKLETVNSDKIYSSFSSKNMVYGPAFRSIKTIWTGDRECLSLIELPKEANELSNTFKYNPSILDGALQSVICAVPSGTASDSGVYIPFFTEEVLYFKELEDRCYSHVKFVPNTSNDEIIKANVEILDPNGNVIVRVKNFCLKKVNTNNKVYSDDSNIKLMTAEWKEKPVIKNTNKIEVPENIVLFRDFNSEHEIFAEQIKALSINIVHVYPGSRYQKISDVKYVVDVEDKDSFVLLFDELKGRNFDLSNIVHLWNYSKEHNAIPDLEQFDKSQYFSSYSLYFIVQGLSKLRTRSTIRIISSNSVVFEEDYVEPEKSTVHAVANVINQENIGVKCFSIDSDENLSIYEVLLNELSDPTQELVTYRKNSRWIRDIVSINKKNKFDNINFKSQGTYVITGGLGGVGSEIAKFIAKNYKSNIVLIGRSNEETTVTDELKAYGAKVAYYKADVSDEVSMSQCISTIEADFGGITGVIHAAGIVKDCISVNSSIEDVKEVFAPKVKGTLILDKLLQKEKLDFMILFSGMVSFYPNRGQSAYAGANMFMDSFAYKRQMEQKARTIAINWWFWGETGMAAKPEIIESLKSRNLRPITNKEGIDAFQRILSTGAVQVLMNNDSQAPIEVKAVQHSKPLTDPVAKGILVKRGESRVGSLKTLTSKYLIEKIHKLIGIVIEETDTNTAFLDLSIDSITLINLSSELEKDAGIMLYPTVFFEYNNVEKLSNYLLEEYKTEFEKLLTSGVEAGTESAEIEENKIIVKTGEELISCESKCTQEECCEDMEKMKAILITRPGSFNNLVIDETKMPEIGPKEVLLRVRAAGINFSDVLTVLGNYPNALNTYPYILGNEVSGIVERVGKEVLRFKVGQEVIGLTKGIGGLAQFVSVDESTVWKKPEYMSFSQGAALPIVFLTAYHCLNYLGKIKESETILIRGAAGGVGLMAIEIAKAAKAVIIGAVGSDEKADYLKSIGVDYTVNYRKENVNEFVMEVTNGKGVDLLLTSSSGDEIEGLMKLVAPNGRFLEMGMAGLRAAPKIDLGIFVENQSFFSMDLKRLSKEILDKHINAMDNMLKNRTLTPINVSSFKYEDMRDAFVYMASRKNVGKVILTFPDIKPLRDKQMAETNGRKSSGNSDIAVIGMSGAFPGAKNLKQYWDNLCSATDSIDSFPESRRALLPIDKDYDLTSIKGGFLEDIDKFDPLFFNISPAEAIVMDPQQRLYMLKAWEAVENAGYGYTGTLPVNTGVFVGVSRRDYLDVIDKIPTQAQGYSVTGNTHSMLASRISYWLNLKGPAIAVDTACSSSLVALHLACESIVTGDCDMAMAGGVNLLITPESSGAFKSMNALSTRCKTFDKSADGFVSSEGVGVLLLKSLDKAIEDGDIIHAVIKGTALNNDGFSNGITAPNPAAQAEVIKKALDKAKVDPETISYIEAHGTGTFIGDPIEIEGLNKVYDGILNKSSCPIGSVKSNIGHAEAAAGVASIIKVILAMKEKKLPPSIHFKEMNPILSLQNTPFFVNDKLRTWDSEVVRAGVSSFGFSGTNAHIIIESADNYRNDSNYSAEEQIPHLFVLSATNRVSLRSFAKAFIEMMEDGEELNLSDICYTAAVGKRQMDSRLAEVVYSVEDLKQKLQQYVDETSDQVILKKDKKIAFYLNSYKGVLDIAIFNETMEECWQIFKELNLKINVEAEDELEQLFRAYSTGKTMESLGVVPSYVIAYGKEIIAAVALSGGISIRDAIMIVLNKGDRTINVNDGNYPVVSIIDNRIVTENIELVQSFTRSEEISVFDNIIATYINENKTDRIVHLGGNEKEISEIDYSKEFPEIFNKLIKCNLESKFEFLILIAQLFKAGVTIKWQSLYASKRYKRVSLPLYPFQLKSYWTEVSNDSIIKEKNHSISFYDNTWQEGPITEKQNIEIEGSYIIFDGTDGLSQRISRQLSSADIKSITVYLGKKYYVGDNFIEINVFEKDHYSHLFDYLKTKNVDISGVIYIPGITGKDDDISINNIEEDFYGNLNALFNVIKSLISNKHTKKIDFITLTFNADNIYNEKLNIYPHMQSLQVLTKVFSNEEKGVNFLNLDFEASADMEFIGRTVTDELLTADRNMDVCYRKGIRFVKDFVKIDVEGSNSDCIKNTGTYIITGGGSNIGIKIAEFVVKQASVRFAFIGRSKEPSEKLNDAMAQIEKTGSKTMYFSCDIADFTELEKTVSKIEANLGEVNGIFHCAGIKDDSLLQNKEFSDFKKVLSPKVKGLFNIEKIFGNKPIEFILLLSSISSYFCNQGQADYSVANCFYNSYAKSALNKSHKRVISLCLPFVNGGGMKSTDVVLKRMENYGIYQIEMNEVIEALEVALSCKHNSTFCAMKYTGSDLKIIPGVYRNKRKCYNKNGKSGIPCNNINKNRCENLLHNAENADNYKNHILSKVRALISSLLILDPLEMDDSVNFGDYGMDSMLIKEATVLFEREFNTQIESSIFLEYPNVAALSGYLSEKLSHRISEIAEITTPQITTEEELNKIEEVNKAVVLEKAEYKNQDFTNNPFNSIIDKFAKGDIDINSACEQIVAQIGKKSIWEEL